MTRFVLVLSLVFAVAASGCAIGIRMPPSEITEEGAVLNGQVFSTTGGQGSYYFEYGILEGSRQRGPTHPIDFAPGELQQVSEPLDDLDFGTVYSYRLCAEDGQNAGSPVCSRPVQIFPTAGQRLRASEYCDFPPLHTAVARVVAPAGTEFQMRAVGPGEDLTDTYSIGPAGFLGIYFPRRVTGDWTFTVELPDETLTESVSVDCQFGS
jgi:hypothetical protein